MVSRRINVLFILALALCPLSVAQGRDGVEKMDVFGGYSWYHPDGNIPAVILNGKFLPDTTLPNFETGWAGQFTYNLNHWAGIALDGTGHYNNGFGNIHSIAAGPQFRLRKTHFSAFGEALIGVQVFIPKQQPDESSTLFLVGGGVDYKLNSRFSVRPIQVDYVNSYYTVSPGVTPNRYNGVRLQAGLVVNFGLPIPKVSALCSVAPAAVEAGAPVRVSVTARGFQPNRTLSYSYASTGGKISGKGATAVVDTVGLAPGSYTVSTKATDNGKAEKQRMASCQTAFKVNAETPKHPPTLSLSAQPSTVSPGGASTITANASSPDNRPINLNCKTSSGRLSGDGPSYALETVGVTDGTVAVNCTVSDDRNLTATAAISVSIKTPDAPVATPAPPATATAPPVAAPALIAKKYGTIGFHRDSKRPTRVDNEAKGLLDRYADALAAAPDAQGVLVGYATPKEALTAKVSSKVFELAAQRAVNTKDYMTKDKGVDPARIKPLTASGNGQKVELWIVPAGATFSRAGTRVVDEAKVKAIPRVVRKKKAVHEAATRRIRKHIRRVRPGKS